MSKCASPGGNELAGRNCRAASRVKRSAISAAAGRNPAANMARIAFEAARMSRKPAESTARAGGKGNKRKVASLTMPNNPSEPTKRPTRSKPVLFLWVRPPHLTMAPLPRQLPGRAHSCESRRISSIADRPRSSQCFRQCCSAADSPDREGKKGLYGGRPTGVPR